MSEFLEIKNNKSENKYNLGVDLNELKENPELSSLNFDRAKIKPELKSKISDNTINNDIIVSFLNTSISVS